MVYEFFFYFIFEIYIPFVAFLEHIFVLINEKICEIYNNIAKKYYMNQDYLKAIEFYNKSLNMHLYVYDVITLPMGRSISLEIEKCKMKQKDELYRFLEYLYQIRKLKPNKYGFLQPAFFEVMFKEYFFPNPKKSYK